MKKSKLTDHELVKRFIDGDQTGFEILMSRHKDKVFTYILLMVKKEHLAQDIFQETFIKVVKSLHAGKYQENGKFISWVIRIAHNLVIDHFRKVDDDTVLGIMEFNGKVRVYFYLKRAEA